MKDAFAEQVRGLIDGGVRRAADRNDHRHAQRQGGAAGGGGSGSRGQGPAHPVGNHHRPQRPDVVRADHRRLLGVGDARPPACRRHQLRARGARDAAIPRRAVARRDDLRQLLSERRAAERLRAVRPARAGNRRVDQRFRHQRLRQHRRRLLRHDPGSHPRDCRAGGRRPGEKIPTADGRPSFKSPHTQFAGLEVLTVRATATSR